VRRANKIKASVCLRMHAKIQYDENINKMVQEVPDADVSSKEINVSALKKCNGVCGRKRSTMCEDTLPSSKL